MKKFSNFEITYLIGILKEVLKGIDKDNGYNEREYNLLDQIIRYLENK